MKFHVCTALTAFLVLIHVGAVSQNNIWKTPQPLTDSLSLNQNPVISFLDYYDGPGFYVFWERSQDSLPTGIYTMNFYAPGDPQALVYDNNHSFTNPQVINTGFWMPDTSFFMLYESDQGGNLDVYLLWMSANAFLDTVAITTDTMDDTHMRANSDGCIVWENSGKIIFTYIEDIYTPDWYVSDPVIVSDSNSRHPVISCSGPFNNKGFIAWEHLSDSNVSVYYSTWGYNDTIWTDPVLLYNQGNNSNLRFNNDFWGFGFPLLVWDSEENGTCKLMAYDFEEEEFFELDMLQGFPYHPSLFPLALPVNDFYSETFLAFEGSDSSAVDIFVSEYSYLGPGTSYINLSSSMAADRNPQFFLGEYHSFYQDFILIWESERNNMRQLWSSVFTMPMGSVSENNATALYARCFPNPFVEQVCIEYELHSPSTVSIKIFNGRGVLVCEKEVPDGGAGKQTFTWRPGKLPAGIYYARLCCHAGEASLKLLKH